MLDRVQILQGILIFFDCECLACDTNDQYQARAEQIISIWDADVEESSQAYFDVMHEARIPFGVRVRIESILSM